MSRNSLFAALCIAILCMPQYAAAQSYTEEGIASWYGNEFNGRPTASGEIFNSALFTAAHPTLPFGTFLVVTNKNNNRQVTVKVNDRGPFVASRIIDLSKAAAEHIDMVHSGTAPVVIATLPVAYPQFSAAPPPPAPAFSPPPPPPPAAAPVPEPAASPVETQSRFSYPPITVNVYQPPAPVQDHSAVASIPPPVVLRYEAPVQQQQPQYQQAAPAAPRYEAPVQQPQPQYQQAAPAAPHYEAPVQQQQPQYQQAVPTAPQYEAPVQQQQPQYQQAVPTAPQYEAPVQQQQPQYQPPPQYQAPAAPYYEAPLLPPPRPQYQQPAPYYEAPLPPLQIVSPPEAYSPSSRITSHPEVSLPPPQAVVPQQAATPPPPPVEASPPPPAAPPPVVPPSVVPPSVPLPQAAPPVRDVPSGIKLIPAINPLPNSLYKLQIGSYKAPRNAVEAFEKLKGAGLNPAYERHEEFYRVVLSGVRGTEIQSVSDKLARAGFREAIIREER